MIFDIKKREITTEPGTLWQGNLKTSSTLSPILPYDLEPHFVVYNNSGCTNVNGCLHRDGNDY